MLRNHRNKKVPVDCFCIDNELVYWNFFLDFGPLNLGQLHRFSTKLNYLIQQQELKKKQLIRATSQQHQQPRTPKRGCSNTTNSSSISNEIPVILFYSSTAPAKRANAIFLICAWQMLYLSRTPEEAFHGFKNNVNAIASAIDADNGDMMDEEIVGNITQTTPVIVSPASSSSSNRNKSSGGGRRGCSEPPPLPFTTIGQNTIAPLPPFHDASPCACTYDLTLLQCLYGLQKARRLKFFDWDNFDVDEYEHFEQVEVRSQEYTSIDGVRTAVEYVHHGMDARFCSSCFSLKNPALFAERGLELDHPKKIFSICWTVLQEECQC